MNENKWDPGKDDEELFELAIHDRQYRDYKSGIAKTRFESELAKAIEQSKSSQTEAVHAAPVPSAEAEKQPKIKDPNLKEIIAPAKGKIYYNLFGEFSEYSVPGETIYKGDRICYIQTSSYIEEIICPYNGEIAEVVVQQSADVTKGELLFTIKETQSQPGMKKTRMKTKTD